MEILCEFVFYIFNLAVRNIGLVCLGNDKKEARLEMDFQRSFITQLLDYVAVLILIVQVGDTYLHTSRN